MIVLPYIFVLFVICIYKNTAIPLETVETHLHNINCEGVLSTWD